MFPLVGPVAAGVGARAAFEGAREGGQTNGVQPGIIFQFYPAGENSVSVAIWATGAKDDRDVEDNSGASEFVATLRFTKKFQ